MNKVRLTIHKLNDFTFDQTDFLGLFPDVSSWLRSDLIS